MVEPGARQDIYRAVLEQMADAFFLMGAIRDDRGEITDFTLLDCNELAARRLNRQRQDAVGQLYSVLYPQARERGVMELLARVVDTGERYDGELAYGVAGVPNLCVWLRVMPIPNGVAITSTDLTQQKQLEDAHDSFFRLAPDMLCVAGLDGYFKRLSASWQQVLGWTLEELMSRPFIEFVHPDDREKTRYRPAQLIGGGAAPEFENRYRHKDGSYRVLAWRTAVSKSHDLMFCTARDITDLHASAALLQTSKERLAQSERVASLGTLAAVMGHEINNPLVAVLSNLGFAEESAQLVLRALDGTPEAQVIQQGISQLRTLCESLADATQGAKRVQQIVQDLRRFVRSETAASQALKISEVLEAALEIARPELGKAHVVKELGHTPLVSADQAKLAQVFANLLVNAAQALDDTAADRNEIRIRTSRDAAGGAVIEIIDTGIGIAADVLPRVLDPFFTTKRMGEGIGLGLAISHHHVATFGGEITAHSTPGLGTTFRVTLPAARAPVRTQTIRLPIIETSARAKVLVIDDEEVVGRSLYRVLSRFHDVDVVKDGPSALELIARTRYEMILCDIMMPNMSGVDVFEAVSRSNPEQASRMVFMTGGAFTVRTQEFMATTTNPLVLKPFSADQIRSIAAKMIVGGTVTT